MGTVSTAHSTSFSVYLLTYLIEIQIYKAFFPHLQFINQLLFFAYFIKKQTYKACNNLVDRPLVLPVVIQIQAYTDLSSITITKATPE